MERIHPFNSLNINPLKWSYTLKQFVGNLPMNCLSVFDHFVKLAMKELMSQIATVLVLIKNINPKTLRKTS